MSWFPRTRLGGEPFEATQASLSCASGQEGEGHVFFFSAGRARFAQQRLEHALALDLRHGTDESLAATCLNICTVLSHLEQHERALKFAESATLLTGGDDAGDDDCEDLDEYEEGFDARGGCGGGDNPGLSAAAHFNLGVQQEALSRLGLAKLADAIQSYDRARALTELSVQADQQRLAADAGQIEPGRAAATAALARRATYSQHTMSSAGRTLSFFSLAFKTRETSPGIFLRKMGWYFSANQLSLSL